MKHGSLEWLDPMGWVRTTRCRAGSGSAFIASLVITAAWTPGLAAQGEFNDLSSDRALPTWELSLEEALATARLNNPGYRQAAEATEAGNWRVREAYGAFLPTVTASGSATYQGEGQQLIGSFTGDDLGAARTDYFLSGYALNVNYSLSGAQIYGVSSSRAEQQAVNARADAAAHDLNGQVTSQYLTAIRAMEAVAVARQLLTRAEQSLELARARVEAGAAPGTDATQAEIDHGRAAIALVRAESADGVEQARLLEVLGVVDDRPLALTSTFEIFDPRGLTGSLPPDAIERHPTVQALRQTERARGASVRQAQSGYLPTLSVSAGWSGFTRQTRNEDYLLAQAENSFRARRADCEFWNGLSSGLTSPLDGYPRDCSQLVLSPEGVQAILAANDVFPFDFVTQPFSASVRVAVPVFQGFSRRRLVEEAEVQARSAAHARRAGELRLRTDLSAARGSLEAAYDVVIIEERNREMAREQLDFIQERYRLGAAALLELLDAQSSAAAAERDHLNAVFEFHRALVELERVSGLPLRPEEI